MSMDPTWKRVTLEETGVTSHQGEVMTTRRILEMTFGPPSFDDPTGASFASSTVEWDLQFSDGTVVTIYDSDIIDNATGETTTPGLDELYEWHIGGREPEAVTRVLNALGHNR